MNPNMTALTFLLNVLQTNETVGAFDLAAFEATNATGRCPNRRTAARRRAAGGRVSRGSSARRDRELRRHLTEPDDQQRASGSVACGKWAKKQKTKAVEKRLNTFLARITKKQNAFIHLKANEIYAMVLKELLRIYTSKFYGYSDVCDQMRILGEDLQHKVVDLANDGPLNHVECSIDDKEDSGEIVPDFVEDHEYKSGEDEGLAKKNETSDFF
ncbi:hypothetical protein M3Y99_01630300 [Aphelenchoides fujianensis]|nr:hypothetical protein M3Y99_01630300 [Aphelenchoides fujianensis]